MPEQAPTFVKNAQNLISILGEWPTFHDAEICAIRLDRHGVSLEIDIFVFKTNPITDVTGHFERKAKTLVTLRFHEVEDLLLEDFNHQNVLASLTLRGGEKIEVLLEGIFGLSGRFMCAIAEVSRVTRYEPHAP